MSARLRKFVLTAHVVTSVGWLGAVATVLALAIAGLVSTDPATVRAAYLALDMTGWTVLVPLSIASLVTGVVQALAGTWGLFRHYWVVIKLVINVLATAVLLLYTQTLASLADLARNGALDGASLEHLERASPVLHAAAALILLLVATVLAIYKPRGRTRYGERKRREAARATPEPIPRGG